MVRKAASLLLLLALTTTAAVEARTATALANGRSWLVSSQNADGSFGSSDELVPRDSAAALQALAGGPADPAIDRGAAYLAALPEGAAYYRALRVQALARTGGSVDALIGSLGEFRNGDGMGAFGSYYSNLFDSTHSIAAYSEDEQDHVLDIVPLLDYLRTSQGTDGGWGYLPGNPSQVFYTGEALWAMSRLRTLAVAPQVIANARTFLLGKLQSNGTFGSVVETAVAYRGLVASGYQFTASQPDPVSALLAAQQADGSWEGDAFTTAEVVRALSAYGPNLVVSALSASPRTVTAGSLVQVTVTVQNSGAQEAATSRLVLRAGSADGTDQRGEAQVPALASGATFSTTLEVATTGAQGELVLYAVADADGVVAENSELDNTRSVRVGLQGLPNLAVFPANVTLSVVRPQPATAFAVRVTIQNLGEQAVPSFGYRVTRVVDGAPVATLPQGTRGPLAAGGSLLLDVPGVSLPEGEHTVRVELDPAQAVAEGSEEDNDASLTFFVVDDTLPDFALADADLTTTPADPVAGSTVNVSLIVRNKGNQSGTGVVEVFDGEPPSGRVVLTRTVTIGAGGSSTITGTFTAQAGSVLVTAVADRAALLKESDEANNRARRYLRQLPDLAVGWDGVDLLPPAPLAGDPVTARVTVRNAGSLASPAAELALFGGRPESGGVEVARVALPAVAAAANTTVDLAWTAVGGSTDLVVVVDPDDAILERSEANNRTVRPVQVPRASGPNLQVTAVDLAALSHSATDLAITGAAGLTLANTGTETTAGAFLVRLFEDLDGDRRFDTADRELASAVVSEPVAAGANVARALELDTMLTFARSLVLADVDAADTIAETREDDNQRALFGDCEETPPQASFEPMEKWHLPDVDVGGTPAVVQLSDDNGDGLIDSRDNPDVVAHATDALGRLVLAVSGLDGSQLWAFRSTAANPLQGSRANVSAADLDGDGIVEVLAVQTDNRLLALDHRGLVRWVSEPIEGTGGDWRGGSAVGDLTGDGVPEIVVGRAVLSNTGKRIAIGTANAARNHNYYGPFGLPYPFNQQHAIIADVDLDGRGEVIAGDTVYRLVDGVLTVVWDYVEHDNMLKDGFAGVGNLDADPYPEIVYVSAGFVKVIQHDGTSPRGSYARIVPVLPPIGDGSMITFWGGPPTIADLTGDGVPEILVVGDTHLVAFSAGLGVLWRKPTFDFGGMTAATAFDLDGDGKREVIYNDERSFFILDGPTGAVLHQRKNTSLTGTELPVVVDLDNDGVADILVGSNRDRYGDGSTRGLHAFGHPSWRGARSIWNQHSYHVTNVQLDGTVPAREQPSWQLTNTFRANLELPRPQQRRLPNLTIGLPRLGAAGAQGIPVTLRIGNGGGHHAGAGIEVTLTAAAGGPAVGSARTTGPLDPGGWEDVVVHWQAPISGPVAAIATVDPGGLVAQCDRGDDSLAFEVSEPLLPDFAIPAGGVTATGIGTSGQVIRLQVQVRNHGPAAAPASRVRVADGPQPLGEAAVAALAPGATATVGVDVDTLQLSAGVHSFHALVDPDALVAEVDEENNGGLIQLDLPAATKPDLDAVRLTVEPGSVTAGTTVALRVEVLNRGTALAGGFAVSFRINGAEVGRVTEPSALGPLGRTTVAYDLSTLGRQGTLAVAAVVDPANAIAEVNETNNTATASLVVAGSPVTLAVATDKPRYKPTETAQISVAANNASSAAIDGTLRVTLQGSAGAEVAVIGERAVSLPAGASTQAFSWPATAALPGSYFVVATVVRDGAPLARAQNSLTVLADVSVVAQVATDLAVYRPHATAILSGGARNTSSSTILSSATADLAIVAPGGQVVHRQTIVLAQLLPGAFTAIAGTWPVGTTPPGVYGAELRVLNSAGELLAQATRTFQVEDTSATGAGVRGELTATPAVQGVGGSIVVEHALENRGNNAAPGLVAHLELLSLATGEPVRTLDVPTPLAAGASTSGRWRIQTADLAPGPYVVSLAAVVAGNVTPLSSRGVTLLPGLVIDDLEVREGDSGSRAVDVTVRLLPASDQTVTVDFATADGSALAGEDYVATTGTLTFAPGETMKTVAITVHGDTSEELHETLLVNLTAATVALIGDGQAVVTLEDEEGCASTNLLENGGGEEVGPEGSFAAWTAVAGGWDGGFAAPEPFTGLTYFLTRGGAVAELGQDVSLAPFASRIDVGSQGFVLDGFVAAGSPAARVVVEYRDEAGLVLDTADSGPLGAGQAWQSVVLRRVAPTGARQARVRLLADGTAAAAFDRLALRSLGVVTLFAADREVAESAGAAAVSLDLSCAADTTVAVAYQTADVEARAGEDYTAAGGSATFAPGQLTAAVQVPLQRDVLDEVDERLQLALSSSDVIVLTNPATVTVLDDDGAVAIAVADAAVTEGDSGTVEAVFPLTLSAPSGREVRVSYATAAETATTGSDFAAASGTVVFPAGVTEREVRVLVQGDRLDELAETFRLGLSAPVNASLTNGAASATIVDDDTASIVATDAEVVEGNTGTGRTAQVAVALSVASDRAVTVSYTTVADSATTPADFTATGGVLTFPAGSTLQTIAVAVVGESLEETTESFLVVLSNPQQAELGDAEATVTIVDDDGPVLSIGDVAVSEGNSSTKQAVFTVTSNRASVRTVTVDVATADREATAPADYAAVQTSLTFAPGEIAKTVVVEIAGERVEELDETFVVHLLHPVNTALARTEAVGTILDDDVFIVDAADLYLVESKPQAQLKLTLNRASEDEVRVRIASADDVATAGQDYLATAETVVFPPGSREQVVLLPLVDDTMHEGPERFWIDLTEPVGAYLARQRVGAHLLDDEKPASFPLTVTARDFKVAHPDIHTCSTRLNTATILGADGKPVYASGGSGATNFAQWYNDTPGVNLTADYDIALTRNGANFEYWQGSFFPIDGRLYGNDSGSHNFFFSAELHAWFTYEPGATIVFGGDNDTWCFINNRLAIQPPRCPSCCGTATANLDSLAASLGLVQGDSYRLDCFHAERGPGGSALFLRTPLYLQQFGPGTLQVIPAELLVVEGAMGNLQVQRIGGAFGAARATAASTGGSATAGVDYTALSTAVTFAHADRAAKSVTLPTLDDGLTESDETVDVELGGADPASSLTAFSRSTVRIVDDESLPVPSLLNPVVAEGTGEEILLIGVALAGENRFGATVTFASADGTAVAGTDYRSVSGTLQFNPGETIKHLQIRIIGDTATEGDEWLELVLGGTGHRGVGSRLRLTLADDDRCGTPNLLNNASFEQLIVNGQVPGWTTVGPWANYSTSYDGTTVYVFGAAGELSQDIDLSGFTRMVDRGGLRFGFRIGVLSWVAENPMDTNRVVLELRDAGMSQVLASFDSGETRPDPWLVISSVLTAPPGSRWLRVRLIGKRYSGSHSETHFDAALLRALDVPSIGISDASFAEGQAGPTPANLSVTLSCATTSPVTFDFASADGTARAGQDYEAAIGNVSIAAGSTAATIPLRLLGDTVSEGNETLVVRLENPVEAVLPEPQVTVTIVDDESRLSVAGGSKNEGNEGSSILALAVTLDKALTLPVTVDYATEDYSALAGEDYLAATGTLIFAPGETSKSVPIEILGDTTVEPDEELFLVLSNSNNAGIAQERAAAKIKQDDIEISIGDARVIEGNTGQRNAVFDVKLSSASAQQVSVKYQTADVQATAGTDYTSRSGTLNFSAGTTLLTIAVPVFGDTVAEGTETFTVQLSQPVNASLAAATEATGFIIDDDDCPSVNLLVNPGAEAPLVSGEIPGWSEVLGTAWSVRTSSPSPIEGTSYFAPGSEAAAELAQDVDVSSFAQWIDLGVQRFSFEGYVVSGGAAPVDQPRVVVEYRDAANANVLAIFDSGPSTTTSWRYLSDLTTAPAGTRWVRVRLVATRQRPSGFTFAFFDGLSLRSLGTPTVLLTDRLVVEGDEQSVLLPYDIQLSCAGERPVTLAYTTVDGTARAATDYAAAAGTFTYAPGETGKTATLELFGDFLNEVRESFRLEVSNVVNAVVLDRDATITLVDADPGTPPVSGQTNVYTLDQDFDLGFAVGLNHDDPNHDQLQLDPHGGTYPFIWIAASAKGTIVKIDTRNGQILGEYSTNPDNRGNSDPSRTTVAFDGSVWVGNRSDGSVTHVGLLELGQCVDRNDNGFIETSAGYGDVRPWPNAQGQNNAGGVSTAADECILHYVKVRMSVPRHVSLDREGRIWVGGLGGSCSGCFDQLDGNTGALLRQVNFPCGGYGGVIDSNGVLWSASDLLRWDPATAPETARCLGVAAYGVALGRDGHIYANEHDRNRIWKVAPDGTVVTSFARGTGCGQGLAVDANDHVWSSSSRWCATSSVGHARGNGTFVGVLTGVPHGSSGVSVDDNGKIWFAADQANQVFRIDPNLGPIGADGVSRLGAVDLVVDIPGAGAYNYSDMTGFQALRHTLRQGSWSTIQDAGIPGAEWGVVSWNTEPQASVPAGSSIVVEVRTANKVSALGPQTWLPVTSGQRFQRFGRYLQVRVTLRLGSATAGPVLSDLRIGIQEPEVRVGDATVAEGNSGTTAAAFGVTLSETVGHAVTVSYEARPGTATAGADFEAVTGSFVIPAGSTSGTITVPVVGDVELEEDETFTLLLLAAPGGRLVDPAGDGLIVDDDGAVTASKVDALLDDRDGNGVVTPGDVVGYTVTITSVASAPLSGVIFEDPVPANSAVVAGSVTTDNGGVQTESPVRVALGELAAGGTATIRFAVVLAVPWPAGVGELVNQGRVTGLAAGHVLSDDPDLPGAEDPTVTALSAVPVLAVSKRDQLVEDADGDGHPSPGDTLRYELVVGNTGTVAATQVVLQDVAPPRTTVVAGSVTTDRGTIVSTDPVRVELGTFEPGGSAAIAFAVKVASPVPVGFDQVVNQASLSSAELPAVLSDDPDLPGRQDSTATTITASPDLVATKTDELVADADGDGRPSPGDTIAYTVRLGNSGNVAATGVGILDPIPAHTTLVAGSAAVTGGTLLGVDPVQVEVGELQVGAEAVLSFRVRIVSPIEPWVNQVVNQATVLSAELEDLPSDDPEQPGVADPTVTPVAAAPVLSLAKTDVLHQDTNGDGYASPGEVVLYQLTLGNSGNTAATDVVLTDTLPPHVTIEPGSLQTSQGTIASESPVQVALGNLAAGANATISFRVRIDTAFPVDATEIANQATVSAAQLSPLSSDDPETPEAGDPTRTRVVVPVEASVADVTVGEAAGTATFEVVLARPSQVATSVAYSATAGTAAAGADFTAATGMLTLPAGQTSGTIAVPLLDDTLDELDETFMLTLSSPVALVLTDAESTGTILDDDAPPALTVTDITVTEGDAGRSAATFTLTLSAPSGLPIALSYATAGGTAGSADFAAATGSVSFAPGETSRTITVDVLGDLLDEEDETFTLLLVDPQQVVLARSAATATILDDDAPPALSIADVAVDEGNSGTVEARFAVTLSAASGREVRVSYATAAVEATPGADFQPVTGVLAIAAGTTSVVVVVPVVGDTMDEPEERFELRFAEPVNVTLPDAVGVGTIRDDDGPPTLSVGDVSVHEGNSGLVTIDVPLELSAPTGFVVSVNYTTVDGTATAPADYLPATDTAMIPAGSTQAIVRLQVRGDLDDEADELFQLRLSQPTNAVLGDAEGTVTIVDDDETVAVAVSIGDVTVTEGHTGTTPATFGLSLSQPSNQPVSVDYATTTGTAQAGTDFDAASGQVTFPPGTTTSSVSVEVRGDLLLEPDETFDVILTSPVGGVLGDASGRGTIVDDETCQGPELVTNGGAETRPPSGGGVPGWTKVGTASWTRSATPPYAGGWSLAAPVATSTELYQDVDLRAFAPVVAGGQLRLALAGSAFAGGPAGTGSARLLLELRNEANNAVLFTYDSGELAGSGAWSSVLEVITAPVGTGWARLRLVAARQSTATVLFDGMSLRSLRVPSMTVNDMATYEGDSGQHDGIFKVLLACPYAQPVTVAYATADGTASAGTDYVATSGSVTFQAGETEKSVPVPVLGDLVYEGHERFSLGLSSVQGGEAILLDPAAEGLILDDDFCPRSPGYWKTHPEHWKVDYLVLGGREYDRTQMAFILGYSGSDASYHLARQLVATKLNLLVGGDPGILPAVNDADAFLVRFPPGSNPTGANKTEANAIKARLETYNTQQCAQTVPR